MNDVNDRRPVPIGEVLGGLILQHGLPAGWMPVEVAVVVNMLREDGERGFAVLLSEGVDTDAAARTLSLGWQP